MDRREIFKSIAVAGLLTTAARAQTEAVPDVGGAPLPLPQLRDPGEMNGEMLYRKFGATGQTVSAIGFGGSHFAKPGIPEAESIRLCHQAIDRGMTFMDNSWDYNKGVSEERMGKALSQGQYRSKVFLMTKVDGRDDKAAQQQLDQSLQRLKTDHVDLWQFHEILRFDDPDRIFRKGGAIETAMRAKKAGKIRWIGYTGHKDPHIHLYMLEVAARHGFHFDAVLFPSNVMDAHFRSFSRTYMPRALSENLAIQTMKPFGGADGVILKSGAKIQPIECLHYALNLPTSVVITGIDNQKVLDQAFTAAKQFKPLSQQQLDDLLARSASAGRTGDYELFKTSAHFDTTAKNAAWLGGEDPLTEKLAPKNAG